MKNVTFPKLVSEVAGYVVANVEQQASIKVSIIGLKKKPRERNNKNPEKNYGKFGKENHQKIWGKNIQGKKSGKNRQKIRENLLRYLNLHAKNMYFKGLKLIKCLNFRAKNP